MTLDTGEVATFSVFVQGDGTEIPFDPGNRRIMVSLISNNGLVYGFSSVAVRTHTPACAP